MTIEQLRRVHQARPFRPFVLHLAEGRRLSVPHSEFLSHSPSGRTVIVHESDESYSIVDLLLVTRIEVIIGSPAGFPKLGRKVRETARQPPNKARRQFR